MTASLRRLLTPMRQFGVGSIVRRSGLKFDYLVTKVEVKPNEFKVYGIKNQKISVNQEEVKLTSIHKDDWEFVSYPKYTETY